MTVCAIAMVKDEADIIGHTITHMRDQVEMVIVADNGSTDGTREIMEAAGAWVLDDRDPGYYQSAKMTHLAKVAIAEGADWVVPFDADEIWFAHNGYIRSTLKGLPSETLIAEATLFDHVATGQDDLTEDNPLERIGWRRRDPAPLRKVAVRAHPDLTIHQGNHSAAFLGVRYPLTVTGQLEIHHFPYRSVEQFVSKVKNGAAAYLATDLPEEMGAHWRGYGRILAERGEEGIAELFHTWFYREHPDQPITIAGEVQEELVFDPCRIQPRASSRGAEAVDTANAA